MALLSRNRPKTSKLENLAEKWLKRWEQALDVWSRFTKLRHPTWCLTAKDEKQEGLLESFAMIRLVDHSVVIGLRQVERLDLDNFAVEILAHEIGHHVYAPGDLRDNARLTARVKSGLPTREHLAPMTANLYTDLLINDRLQRGADLDMAGVYKKLKVKNPGEVWTLYMHIYEVLWGLPAGTLSTGVLSPRIRTDAALGARLVRSYRQDWLRGAGRFAALFLSYFLKEDKGKKTVVVAPWLDTGQAGAGGTVPDGLTEIEDDELEGAVHPAEDPDLTGLDRLEEDEGREGDDASPAPGGRAVIGGRKNRYREPADYTELLKSLGVELSDQELIVRYYRERARPHLIKYPSKIIRQSSDPFPEGLETWQPGFSWNRLDWVESLFRSPEIIPGVTTFQRTFGALPGGSPERRPFDIYLGVDCSGSMINPKFRLSYPVLAGAIIVLSALRAGARCMVTLSGEPGQYSSTDGFIRNEREILNVLTGYLGTGYAFGIERLKDTFLMGDKLKDPVHIMIITDGDIFTMLEKVPNGWGLAGSALEKAGGGGTYVLHGPASYFETGAAKMSADGWNVHAIQDWPDLVAFARAFTKDHYETNGKK